LLTLLLTVSAGKVHASRGAGCYLAVDEQQLFRYGYETIGGCVNDFRNIIDSNLNAEVGGKSVSTSANSFDSVEPHSGHLNGFAFTKSPRLGLNFLAVCEDGLAETHAITAIEFEPAGQW
jgi:hypothetical protein